MLTSYSKETYIFTKDQLRVLLSGCGYKQIIGINPGQQKLTNQEVINEINELVKMGILISDGEKFIMNDNVNNIIKQIGTANQYIAIHSRNSLLPDLCCYSGSKLLISSFDECNSNIIKFSQLDVNELADKLLSEGYFPSINESDFCIDDDELINYENKVFRSLLSETPLDENSSVILDIQFSKHLQKEDKWLRVVEYPLYNYIIINLGKSVSRVLFDEDNAKAFLNKLFLENEL